MEVLNELLSNRVFLAAATGWLVAQILKTFIHMFFTKEFVAERLVGSGGMPSSHSSTVCALSVATAYECGVGSVEFAIAAFLGIIVMYDAMNVRHEAGKHAKWINIITTTLKPDIPFESKFKEYLGHTPLQVFMGALLGIAVAFALA